MTGLVLDAEAVNALLERTHPDERTVRRALTAAHRLDREVVVPTVILAELYRGAGRSRGLDALLSRMEPGGLALRDTTKDLARLVGAVLATARVGSIYLADAHVIAAAVERGGGVVLTGDPRDLERLAAPYRTVVVEPMTAGSGRNRNRR